MVGKTKMYYKGGRELFSSLSFIIMGNEHYYSANIAELDMTFAFRHRTTYKYFEKWAVPCEKPCQVIRVPFSDVEEWMTRWGRTDDAYTEFGLSVFRVSDYLLTCEKCAFHAAAILWNSKAFLFTAQSGTGKTTQMYNWMELYSEESEIMNGDKPVLSWEGNMIRVYPSPWKGKERLGNDSLTAQLGGIIFLEQGEHNSIKRLQPSEAVIPLLSRFLCTVETEKTVQNMCSLEDRILSSVPVWKLINKGDKQSTMLVHEALLQEIDK